MSLKDEKVNAAVQSRGLVQVAAITHAIVAIHHVVHQFAGVATNNMLHYL